MMPTRLGLIAAILASALALVPRADAQERLRFVMVTHGSASDPFWATVKRGADRAAEDMGVELVYRAPETFDLDTMAELVTAAAEEKPSGLIVSIPNADALAGPLRAAVAGGVPVLSINSGFDVSAALGALLHVGQSEYEAGRVAGVRMRDLGGSKALCLNHELGNVALDLRCKGFIDGFGGTVEVLPVEGDPAAVRTAIEERLELDAEIDVILALSASISGQPAIELARGLGGQRTLRVASFDTTEAILTAVADQAAAFAVDQQPFLQGYLPVQFLALLHRDGVVPVSNVSTGPKLVETAEAARRLGRSPPAAVQDAPLPETAPGEPAGG